MKNINPGSEKRYLEFRVAAFNILNRRRLGGIDTNLDSPTFGMIANPQVTIGPHEIQFRLKFYF